MYGIVCLMSFLKEPADTEYIGARAVRLDEKSATARGGADAR